MVKKIFFSLFFFIFFTRLVSSGYEYSLTMDNNKAMTSINKQYQNIQKYKDFCNVVSLQISNIEKKIKNDTESSKKLIDFCGILYKLLENVATEIVVIEEKLKIKLKYLYDFFSLTFNVATIGECSEEYNELIFKHDCACWYVMILKLQKINKKLDDTKMHESEKHCAALPIENKVYDNLYISELYDEDLFVELGKIQDSIIKILKELYVFQEDVLHEKLIIEKKILENNISILEKKLKKVRKNIFFNNTVYEYKKNSYKKSQKNIIMKKNKADKELSDCIDKKKDIDDFNKLFLNFRESVGGLKESIAVNNIEENIIFFLKSVMVEMLSIELFCNCKNASIIDALYLISQKEVSVNNLHNTLRDIHYQLYKNMYCASKEKIQKYIEQIRSILDGINEYKVPIKMEIIKSMHQYKEALKVLKNDFFEIMCSAKFLYKELQDKIFWSRSENSIEFNKIKNFFLEMKLFFKELKNKFLPTIYTIYSQFIAINQFSIMQLVYLLLCFLFILITSFIYKFFFEKLFYIIDSIEMQSYYMRKISLFISIVANHSIFFFVWLNLLFLVYFKIIDYYYINTIFYLFSIPIAIYFMYFIGKNNFQKNMYNEHSGNMAISNIKQFFFNHWGISVIVSLFFFRLALISLVYGNAHKVILVLQFIIMQSELILFFKKREVMQRIINFNLFSDNVKKYITHYYQLIIFFLTVVILMSNPYVGYGNQVFYFFSRFLISLFCVWVWNFIFELVKNYSVYIFFIFEEGEARNMVRNAKLLYVLFLLFFYMITMVTMIYVILNMWGYDVNFSFMTNLIYKNLIPQNNGGEIAFFSLYNLYTPIFYIVKGYVISYLVNTLVLSKILDLIVLGQTMQNTIMILIRYIIISTFFILGLCIAGLEGIIVKLGTLIVGFSFALKEPVADFICYFIILIQCPIKVGDLIRINREGGGGEPEVTGIVRSIKGRTTIIRQRNGQTVIVPNSLIVKRAIFNWTYYKSGFISIEDFVVTIDRSVDVDYIKNIILKVIETHPAVLKNPAPLIRCENITSVGYDFLVRGYISPDRANDQWDIASQLRILLIKKLKQENIHFAIPSYNIYTKTIESACKNIHE